MVQKGSERCGKESATSRPPGRGRLRGAADANEDVDNTGPLLDGGANQSQRGEKRAGQHAAQRKLAEGEHAKKLRHDCTYQATPGHTRATNEEEASPRDPTASSSTMPWAGSLEMRARPAAPGASEACTANAKRSKADPRSTLHEAGDPLVAESKRRRRTSGFGNAPLVRGEAADTARRSGIG